MASQPALAFAPSPAAGPGADHVRLPRFLLAAALVWTGLCLVIFHWPARMPEALLLVALLLMAVRPRYAFLAMLTSVPVAAFSVETMSAFKRAATLVDLALVCLLVGWVYRRLAKREEPYPGTNVDWVVAALIVWAGITLLWSTDPIQGAWEWGKLFLCGLAFFFTVALVRDLEDLRRVVVVILLVGLMETALCIVSLYGETTYNEHHAFLGDYHFWNRLWRHSFFTGRGNSTDTAHNIGVFLTFPSMLGIMLFLTARSRGGRWAAGLTTLVLMGGVMSTMTKGAIGSLWLGVMFVCALVDKTKKRLIACVLASMLVAASLFLVVMARDLYRASTALQMQMDTTSEKTSTGSRLKWWKQGMGELMSNGGFGYGIGGYRSRVNNYVPDGTHAAVLFDLGFIGMILWCLLFLNCFITCWKHLESQQDQERSLIMVVYLGGLVVMVVSWLVTLYYSYVLLWIYMGLGYALVNLRGPVQAAAPTPCFYRVSLVPPLARWDFLPQASPPGWRSSPDPGLGAIPAWVPYPRPSQDGLAPGLATPPPNPKDRPVWRRHPGRDRHWRRSSDGNGLLPPRRRGLMALLLKQGRSPRPAG